MWFLTSDLWPFPSQIPWGTCWPLALRPQGHRHLLRRPSWGYRRLRRPALRCRRSGVAWAQGRTRAAARNGLPGLRPAALLGPRTMGAAAACPTRARSTSATGSAKVRGAGPSLPEGKGKDPGGLALVVAVIEQNVRSCGWDGTVGPWTWSSELRSDGEVPGEE